MSEEFLYLRQEVENLQQGLMSYNQRLDGDYTLEEKLKCQAFVIFAHAEIENYLETVGRRIMKEAKQRWDAELIPDRVIATLLAYRKLAAVPIPQDRHELSKVKKFSQAVDQCIKEQERVIADNNGIKEKNIFSIFLPLGVFPSDIDEVVLIELTQTGKRRGEFVHKKNKVSLQKLDDPITVEQIKIRDLVEEIRKFDARLEEMRLLSVEAHA
jgi:hypothetical protein